MLCFLTTSLQDADSSTLVSQIAREEEEILAERYAKAREQRQQRQERAAVPPAAPPRPPAVRRMSTGDRFRQNQ